MLCCLCTTPQYCKGWSRVNDRKVLHSDCSRRIFAEDPDISHVDALRYIEGLYRWRLPDLFARYSESQEGGSIRIDPDTQFYPPA